MATLWLDPSGGSNSNDGLDLYGFGLTAGSYDDTGHADGDFRLSSTGSFAGYTVTSGDTIYLSGGAGITPGLYEIASKVSDDVLLLASSAGSDSTGDVTSSDGPWLTFQYLVDNIGTDDTAYCCATATETTSLTVDIDTTAGTQTAPIRIWGRNANGSGFAQYTLQAAGSFTGTALLETPGNYHYYRFRCITLDANTNVNHAFDQTGDTNTGWMWDTCVFENGNAEGVDLRNTYTRMFGCTIRNHGADGLRQNANRNYLRMDACNIYGNVSDGLFIRNFGLSHISNCLIWDNGGDGITVENGKSDWSVVGCTIDGNGSDGIGFLGGAARWMVTRCAITNNGAYGIGNIGSGSDDSQQITNNLYYGNTSGATNLSTTPGFDNYTTDPGYADAANGDFTPSASSDLVGNGPFGMMIGAMPPAAGGGGGGTDSVLGVVAMAGGMQ